MIVKELSALVLALIRSISIASIYSYAMYPRCTRAPRQYYLLPDDDKHLKVTAVVIFTEEALQQGKTSK